MITRRQFLVLLAAAASSAPLMSFAQSSPKARRIGFLTPRSHPDPFFEAFRQGMRELGYVDGTNVTIEARYADGEYERLPALAAELISMNLEIIATYGTAAAKALQQNTKSIPIVVAAAVDLVGAGIVASLARPGGNVTGLSVIAVDLSPKQLELLRTVIPRMSRVAVLVNPGNAANAAVLRNVQAAAQPLGVKVLPVEARTVGELTRGFAAIARDHDSAVIVAADAFFSGQGRVVAELSVKHHLPTIGIYRDHVLAGSLMSYGQDIAQFHRQAATFVDKILKGARPADLPVEQPTKFELSLWVAVMFLLSVAWAGVWIGHRVRMRRRCHDRDLCAVRITKGRTPTKPKRPECYVVTQGWSRSVEPTLSTELVQRRAKRGEQVAAALKPAPRDERERLANLGQRRGIGAGQQCGKVHSILRTRAVVSRQHLQGNEMAEPSDRRGEARHRLDQVCRSDDFRFDAGRGKEQVDDGPEGTLTRWRKPDGRQTACSVLFDGGDHAPAAPLKRQDQRLGIPIVGHEHREIGVTRQPRLAPHRHGEAPDQRKLAV